MFDRWRGTCVFWCWDLKYCWVSFKYPRERNPSCCLILLANWHHCWNLNSLLPPQLNRQFVGMIFFQNVRYRLRNFPVSAANTEISPGVRIVGRTQFDFRTTHDVSTTRGTTQGCFCLMYKSTLQRTNISHLGKMIIIFKTCLPGG